MSPQRPTLVLLVIGGLVLLTNPLWLFPHEGDTRYTYERSEIVVENGTLAYEGKEIPEFREENSLNPIGCQFPDDEHPRACAFDAYLVTHGPVTVTRETAVGADSLIDAAEFVRLGDGYYRRSHVQNHSAPDQTTTYDVERVSARTVLATAATNFSDHGGPVSGDFGVELRVALTGDTTTSFDELEESELGRIYRLNGSYYTVVKTDTQAITHGVEPLRYDVPRYLLVGAGLVLLVGALLQMRPDEELT